MVCIRHYVNRWDITSFAWAQVTLMVEDSLTKRLPPVTTETDVVGRDLKRAGNKLRCLPSLT
jgi:hypothetical protein